MEKTWLLNYGHKVGLSHLPNNVPCQDRALCVTKNGVTVAVLSDGCGSSAISEHGAELITTKLCEFFTENFDSLIPEYDDDVNVSRRRIIEHIGQTHKQFIDENIGMFEALKTTQAEKYAKFNNGTAARDLSFYYDTLNATLLFVATKGDQGIVGQVGDGVIVGLQDNKIRILMEEEKNEAVNGTYYPIKLYESGLKNEKYFSAANLFTLKFPKVGSFDGFVLMSDGVDGFIDKRIPFQKKVAPALGNHLKTIIETNNFEQSQQIVDDLLERLRKVSTANDDCSLAIIVNADAHLDDPEYVVKEAKLTSVTATEYTPLYIDNKDDNTNQQDAQSATLDSPWLLNYGFTVGKFNELKGVECQDNVSCLSENGIGIAVLADGNPTSILSAKAAEIATEKISIFLRNNFDNLVETNTLKNKEAKARMLKVITDAYNQFIEHNIEKFEELKREKKDQYKEFKDSKLIAWEENEFYYEFLQSTFTFVACKEDVTICGQVGDGMILGLYDNKFKMISNHTNNEVFYPTDVYRREVYEHMSYQVFTSKIDGYILLPRALGVSYAKVLGKIGNQLTTLSQKNGNFESTRAFTKMLQSLVIDAKGKDASIAMILKRGSRVRLGQTKK